MCLIAIGHLRRHQRLTAPGLGIGGVEALEGVGNPGAEFGEVTQFLLRQVDLPEQGSENISFSSAKNRSPSAVARSRRSRS